MKSTRPLDSELFPIGFFDIAGKTFDWVFNNKKEFVLFTKDEMMNTTGFFATWHQYVNDRFDGESFPTD